MWKEIGRKQGNFFVFVVRHYITSCFYWVDIFDQRWVSIFQIEFNSVFLSNLAWRQAISWFHSVSIFRFKVFIFTVFFSFTGFFSGELELHLCTTTNCSTQLYDTIVDCLKGTVVYHLIDFGRWSFQKPRSFQNFLGKPTLAHFFRTVFADRRTVQKVKFHNIENLKKRSKTYQFLE